MKKSLFFKSLRPTCLAVSASALMLGAAQAGTTVGLNFQAWYYDSGATPQTVGFGYGYQTTGFPVTARAFGVDASNWSNPDPLPAQAAISTSVSFGGTLSAQLTAPNAWQSGIGELVVGPFGQPQSVAPGNNEATWGYLDDGNTTGSSPSVTVSSLAAKFPNGYVISTLAANSGVQSFENVDITDGVTTNTVVYSTYYVSNIPGTETAGGTVGISAPSSVRTSNTIGIYCKPKTSGHRSVLAGFIITDQPVVMKSQGNVSVNQGSLLNLSAGVIGVGANAYQWQHAGTNVPGATTLAYSKVAAPEDAGSWILAVTNAYGSATSDVATVTVVQVPLITADLSPATNSIYTGFTKPLSVVAAGAQPLSYQWRTNGVNIPGATTAVYAAGSSTPGLTGYSVLVTNNFGVKGSSTNFLNAVASPDSYTAQVAHDSPVAYLPLNETVAPLARDYSGFGNNGTQNNGVTPGASGPQPPAFPGFSAGKTAYQLDGASGYIDCGTGPALAGMTDFTIEAWVKTTGTTFTRLISQRSTNGFNGEYMLDINAGGTVAFTLYSGGYQFAFSSSGAVNDGQWHQIAAVRSGANGFIYIDGALSAQASGPVGALDPTLSVGLGKDVRDNSSFFNGSLADVAIYNSALSSSRIISHYATAAGTPFTLHVKSGGLIEDTKPVGTPHPGVNHGATWLASSTDTAGTPVTRTGVEHFSAASGNQIAVPAGADFNSTTGTIMFWMNANAPLPGPGSQAAMLVDRRTTNGTVITMDISGAVFVQCSGGANSFAGGYLPDGNWHHVAVTYDQSLTGSIEIFVDGASLGSQVNTTNWAWPPAQQLELGASHDPYWKRFDGLMDDFRLYNRILTGAEISSVMASDALVDAAALKLRFNFNTAAGVGQSVTWPFGTLYSSPTLGPSAVWTPVSGATPPSYSFQPAGSSLYFRALY